MTRMNRWREREKKVAVEGRWPTFSLSLSRPSVSLVAERDGTGAPSLPRPCSSNLLTYPRTPFNRMFLKRIKRDRFVVSPWIGPSKIRGGWGKGRPTDFLRDFQCSAISSEKGENRGVREPGNWKNSVLFLGERGYYFVRLLFVLPVGDNKSFLPFPLLLGRFMRMCFYYILDLNFFLGFSSRLRKLRSKDVT